VKDEAEAFCLHSRPYRETSLIVELFTKEYGRVSAVAKGVKRKNKSGSSDGQLQPFRPLTVCLTGKSDLKTISTHEQLSPAYMLQGNYLFAGIYLNELLLRLLPVEFCYEDVFCLYKTTLHSLMEQTHLEMSLRHFEFELLAELGYGVPFVEIDKKGDLVNDEFIPGSYYAFQQDAGFIRLLGEKGYKQIIIFKGEDLNAIREKDFSSEDYLLSAKKLIRLMMKPLLGDKPLQSRQLFT